MFDNLDLTSPIHTQYGQLQNQINESGNELFGANTPAEVRDKQRESRLFRMSMDKGRDLSQAKQNEINIKSGGYMSLGQATAPVMYNPGGTSTSVQPINWMDVAGLGVQGAGVAATAA